MYNQNHRRNMGVRGFLTLSQAYCLLVFVVTLVLVYLYEAHNFNQGQVVAEEFNYPQYSSPSCQNKARLAADHLRQRSVENIQFSVVTPTNYRADFAHPLLIVWAPSGFNEKLSERFTSLTSEATENGFVVVYVHSIRLSLKGIEMLSKIPSLIMDDWCIDPSLVFFTGHSDGGTVSNALAVMPGLPTYPRALAPSAMGMRGKDMKAYGCPRPTSIMLMHNNGDRHFPGFGKEVIEWWANCNHCSGQARPSDHAGCIEFIGCTDGATTLFCEAEGGHTHWPGAQHDPMKFFIRIVNSSR